MYVFEKDQISFSVQKKMSYFWEKEISSFLIIQERSYPSAIFLERTSFQNIWIKKIAVTVAAINISHHQISFLLFKP